MPRCNSICPPTPSAIERVISKTYILLRCGVVMPKRITDRPIQPKRRRRGGFHLITYEAVFLLILLPVAFVSVVFLSSYPVENWGISAERALILAKVLAVAFLVITMLLIRFDKLSVIREKESFEFAMKEYEMLRSKWIDAEEKSRMEHEEIVKIFDALGGDESLLELWLDYEGERTPEGRFVKACDKLDMALQASVYSENQGLDLSEFINSALDRLDDDVLRRLASG